jgi:branched-chain amino acid transport system substrate-binding protein
MTKAGTKTTVLICAVTAGLMLEWLTGAVAAEKKYDPGVSDTEIRIGQTLPYSGPASAIGTLGRVESAYFEMINAAGGVNGRKITLISLDDAYSPPKTVEQTRRLVEQDEVFAIVGTFGTPGNLAISKYLNGKKIPQILVGSGSPKLSDPRSLPWTTPFVMSLDVEAKIHAWYLLTAKRDARIAILYQNDDFGRGYVSAIRASLGGKASTMIVKELSYEVSAPTIDSQIGLLKAAGADTLLQATTPKFAAQAIRKATDIGWKPLQILPLGASQISAVLRPAGLEASTGALTAVFAKAPDDPSWSDDGDMRDFHAFLKKWAPTEVADESTVLYGYMTAQMAVHLLKNCGDELTRENLRKQATNIRNLQLPMFLPGLTINVSPSNYTPWHQAKIVRFDGTRWIPITDLIAVSED